jgi:Tol biopolymer transport system component
MRRAIELVFVVSVVLTAGGSSAGATFPGTNGKVAFTSFGRHGTDVAVVEPDGTGAVLLKTFRRDDYEPSWSPDGTRILYESESQHGGRAKIKSMAADGTDRTVIYEAPDRIAFMIRPVWSPDGSQIAFCAVRRRTLTRKIFTMNADGSSVTNISGNDHNDDCYPDWSPDGTKIAFSNGESVVTTNVNGSTRAVVHEGFWPSWSPDGTIIAYENNLNIFVVDADGSNAVRLTDTRKRFEATPSFSPDGTLIAFSRDHRDEVDLFTVALADLATTRLTESDRRETAPSWQSIP